MTAVSPAPLLGVLLGPFLMLLATARPEVPMLGLSATLGDVLFGLMALLLAADVLAGRVTLRWRPAWLALGAYGAAMLLSLIAAPPPDAAVAKLVSQAYLLAIPLIIVHLVADEAALASACRWWLAGSAALACLAVAGLIAFVVAPHGALYRALEFHQGSLPPGPYPRFRLSFLNGNLAANYAGASMMVALLSGWNGWIGARPAAVLAAAMVAVALLALSPGSGAILLSLGWWGWMTIPRRGAARASLACGIVAALGMLIVTATTAAPRAGLAPLLVLPGGAPLWPSIRLTIWQAALERFAASPWLGHGVGVDPVAVSWVTPGGELQGLTDAHQVYLSIAIQAGMAGLVGLFAILALAGSRLRGPQLPREPLRAAAIVLAAAFLAGMAIDGLTGSFEDARHLWAVLGLMLAATAAQSRARGIQA